MRAEPGKTMHFLAGVLFGTAGKLSTLRGRDTGGRCRPRQGVRIRYCPHIVAVEQQYIYIYTYINIYIYTYIYTPRYLGIGINTGIGL